MTAGVGIRVVHLVLGLGMGGLSVGCSGTPARIYPLKHIVLHSLHFRRPESRGVSPSAFPGERGYQSQPLPDSKWDCKPFRELFSDVKLKTLRECFSRIEVGNPLIYRLNRGVAPFLELSDSSRKDQFVPACIKQNLKTINVPREIFFQIDDLHGKIECFSARLRPREEEFLEVSSRLHRFELKIPLPLDTVPSTDEELLHLLGTWALLPFWDENPEELSSLIVPDGICTKCMGEGNLIKDGEPLPQKWTGPVPEVRSLGVE
jgi:hypothetical protein